MGNVVCWRQANRGRRHGRRRVRDIRICKPRRRHDRNRSKRRLPRLGVRVHRAVRRVGSHIDDYQADRAVPCGRTGPAWRIRIDKRRRKHHRCRFAGSAWRRVCVRYASERMDGDVHVCSADCAWRGRARSVRLVGIDGLGRKLYRSRSPRYRLRRQVQQNGRRGSLYVHQTNRRMGGDVYRGQAREILSSIGTEFRILCIPELGWRHGRYNCAEPLLRRKRKSTQVADGGLGRRRE